jgi:prepilin-type N-terminal cleavage/methylation domain-containing protein
MLKKFFHPNDSAFTLIELLISIAIISLLFGVVLVNSNALRTASGDAKRKADLAAIQSALQNYYADQNYYPRSAGNNATSGTAAFILHGSTPTSTFTSSIGTGNTIPSSVKTYLKTVPLEANTKFCYIAVDSAVTVATTAPPTCTNDRTTNPPGKLCSYYYLFTRLDNPDPNPPTVGAICGETAGFFNHLINP